MDQCVCICVFVCMCKSVFAYELVHRPVCICAKYTIGFVYLEDRLIKNTFQVGIRNNILLYMRSIPVFLFSLLIFYCFGRSAFVCVYI